MERAKDILRRFYFPVHDRVIAVASRIAGDKPLIRARYPASDPLADSQQAAIYVHYDRSGNVHRYVVYQLRELAEAGFRVTFVTNSPTFSENSRAQVAPYCKEIIWRHNIGYDFGAYKDGIASIENIDQLDALILMNDSVYGPFAKLADILAPVDRANVDYWGVTDSYEHRWHLQTYFLMFLPNAIRSPAFKTFWRRLPFVSHKWWVVRNAEVGLSATLQKAGLRAGVLVSYSKLAAAGEARVATIDPCGLHGDERARFDRYRSRVTLANPLNPAQFFWDELIEHHSGPFIKRDLLSTNPEQIPFVSRWRDVIARSTTYDISLIDEHVESFGHEP